MADAIMGAIVEYFLLGVCYCIGWPAVRLLTAGRYPQADAWRTERYSAMWTTAVGFTLIMVGVVAACGQFG